MNYKLKLFKFEDEQSIILEGLNEMDQYLSKLQSGDNNYQLELKDMIPTLIQCLEHSDIIIALKSLSILVIHFNSKETSSLLYNRKVTTTIIKYFENDHNDCLIYILKVYINRLCGHGAFSTRSETLVCLLPLLKKKLVSSMYGDVGSNKAQEYSNLVFHICELLTSVAGKQELYQLFFSHDLIDLIMELLYDQETSYKIALLHVISGIIENSNDGELDSIIRNHGKSIICQISSLLYLVSESKLPSTSSTGIEFKPNAFLTSLIDSLFYLLSTLKRRGVCFLEIKSFEESDIYENISLFITRFKDTTIVNENTNRSEPIITVALINKILTIIGYQFLSQDITYDQYLRLFKLNYMDHFSLIIKKASSTMVENYMVLIIFALQSIYQNFVLKYYGTSSGSGSNSLNDNETLHLHFFNELLSTLNGILLDGKISINSSHGIKTMLHQYKYKSNQLY